MSRYFARLLYGPLLGFDIVGYPSMESGTLFYRRVSGGKVVGVHPFPSQVLSVAVAGGALV